MKKVSISYKNAIKAFAINISQHLGLILSKIMIFSGGPSRSLTRSHQKLIFLENEVVTSFITQPFVDAGKRQKNSLSYETVVDIFSSVSVRCFLLCYINY